ncbi:acyl-CoA thioesterase [Modestobacter sp. URMC 112]
MVHEHPVQLRWSDPDSLGHVNHARALSLLEDARLAMLADVPGGPPDLTLARLEVDYLRQLYYRVGERLTVRSSVARLGTSSVTLRQELAQDGQVALRALAVCVHFDFATDTSLPMTGAQRGHWTAFVQD